MQSKALPIIAVVKKEEKEAKLKAFIAAHLARTISDKTQHAVSDRVVLLIARSHESPVVHALASAVAESGDTPFSLKALILVPEASPESAWPAELAASISCRTIPDLRMLDAHEQLWLDSETVWIGDCMRREPGKRDAYECYADGCTTTAQFVETAFNRLWDKGQPSHVETGKSAASASETLDPHLAQIAPADTSAPTAATRH
jgi:hypothetical protein